MNKKFKVLPLKGVEIHNAKSVGTRTVNLLMGEHEGEYVRGDIMDANAVAQAIDEVRGGIDGSHDSLAKLNEEVKTNATVINGAITYANKIAADLEQETKDRSKEIETLRYDILNKDTEFEDKDELLENKIIIEARDRANADKEINKKIDVINGDSNTDGSIKKAIADVIDAAPEAYDTLKEIADKLKDNDDLHATIQEAITDKASNEALTNEVNRATAKEEEITLNVELKLDKLQLIEESYNNDTHSDYISSLVNYFIDNGKEGSESRTVGGTYFKAASYSTNSYYGSYKSAVLCGEDPRVFITGTGIENYQYDSNDLTIYSAEYISQGIYNIMPLYFLFDIYGCGSVEFHTLHAVRGIIGGPTSNPSDTDVFNTNGGVVDTTKFVRLNEDNKIADSYIPTTVALKTDLSEYIKTKDADSKYLSSKNFIINSDQSINFGKTFNAPTIVASVNAAFNTISKKNNNYLKSYVAEDISDTKVYNTNGGLVELNNYAKLVDGKISADLLPESSVSVSLDNIKSFKTISDNSDNFAYVGCSSLVADKQPFMGIQTYKCASSGDPESINNNNVFAISSFNKYGDNSLSYASQSLDITSDYNTGYNTAIFSPLGTYFPKQVQFGAGEKQVTIDGSQDSYIKLYGCDGQGSIQLDYAGAGSFAYQDKGVYLTDGTIAPINYKNGLAKLDANGNINSLIKPADISLITNENAASDIKESAESGVDTAQLAHKFNLLLNYVKKLENALKAANLLHHTKLDTVVSE